MRGEISGDSARQRSLYFLCINGSREGIILLLTNEGAEDLNIITEELSERKSEKDERYVSTYLIKKSPLPSVHLLGFVINIFTSMT